MDITSELDSLSTEQAALLEALLDEAAGGQQPFLRPTVAAVREGKYPLFVVHGSGGRTFFLHALARHLSMPNGLYGIEAAEHRSATTAELGCSLYLEVLRQVQPRGPYRIGGYSAGCLIAYEMAIRLQAMGETVELVLLIDPVSVPKRDAQPRSVITPTERLRRRFAIASLTGITPLAREFPYLVQVDRVLSAITRDFRPALFVGCVHLIHGRRGSYALAPQALEAWAALATGGLQSATLDCDHFEIVCEPHITATAGQISQWLAGLEFSDSTATLAKLRSSGNQHAPIQHTDQADERIQPREIDG